MIELGLVSPLIRPWALQVSFPSPSAAMIKLMSNG
jgi:hypothetical protein